MLIANCFALRARMNPRQTYIEVTNKVQREQVQNKVY